MEKLLERGSMAECMPCMTLMEERLKLSKHNTAAKVDVVRYWSIIGGLRYLTHTRPNIAFAIGYVSHFMEDPREDHWLAVKRLLRYIKGTLDQAIIFPKSGGKGGLWLMVFNEATPKTKEGGPELTVFNDANMAGDIDGRQSTSGVLVFFGAALIAWQSLKQKIVALST
ncbi:secreted RxLR effector protein 161-like [Miscanthus floridulus]|uniref:secreted RxLR effector protein 161-like n=1 Tax=Miscanthus floridulus TaxID=154761 RepID=UPI00345A098A